MDSVPEGLKFRFLNLIIDANNQIGACCKSLGDLSGSLKYYEKAKEVYTFVEEATKERPLPNTAFV
jgi:hypothetical protein